MSQRWYIDLMSVIHAMSLFLETALQCSAVVVNCTVKEVCVCGGGGINTTKTIKKVWHLVSHRVQSFSNICSFLLQSKVKRRWAWHNAPPFKQATAAMDACF